MEARTQLLHVLSNTLDLGGRIITGLIIDLPYKFALSQHKDCRYKKLSTISDDIKRLNKKLALVPRINKGSSVHHKINPADLNNQNLLLPIELIFMIARYPCNSQLTANLYFYKYPVIIDGNGIIYILYKKLGSGRYGEVSIAQRIIILNSKRWQSDWVAAKSENFSNNTINECLVLYQLNRLVGIFYQKNSIVVLQKLFDGSTLNKNNIKFNLLDSLTICIDLLKDLQELHKKDYVHTDIHAANLIIINKYKESHLIDFGMAFIPPRYLAWYYKKIDISKLEKCLTKLLKYCDDPIAKYLSTHLIHPELPLYSTTNSLTNTIQWFTDIKQSLNQPPAQIVKAVNRPSTSYVRQIMGLFMILEIFLSYDSTQPFQSSDNQNNNLIKSLLSGFFIAILAFSFLRTCLNRVAFERFQYDNDKLKFSHVSASFFHHHQQQLPHLRQNNLAIKAPKAFSR